MLAVVWHYNSRCTPRCVRFEGKASAGCPIRTTLEGKGAKQLDWPRDSSCTYDVSLAYCVCPLANASRCMVAPKKASYASSFRRYDSTSNHGWSRVSLLRAKSSINHKMSTSPPADDPSKPTNTLSFPPSHVLRTVAYSMNWRDSDIVVNIERKMTWKSATAAVLDAFGDHDETVYIDEPRPRGRRDYIKRAALEEVLYSGSGNVRGLPLRSAPDPASLPAPQPTSPSSRAKLRENLREAMSDREPYLLAITAVSEDRYLPSIPGRLLLSGIDSSPDDPRMTLVRPDILFDTGAHTSIVTDDVLDSTFRAYLSDPIHDPYRSSSGVRVQVAGVLAFGAHPPLEMDCLFTVVPLNSVPNGRSGVILGQHTVIDSIQYLSKPRNTLVACGDEVADTVWGDILVDGYVNVDGDYVKI